MERFQSIFECQIKGKKITKFRSTKTGLTLTHIDADGPIVKGYFTLATEETGNDGLPHTLEHLIFMGSECYPYKGILDLAANQCFAQGTNAWTAVDHTAYTVETAGSDGFLTLLPIYLDHILFPTLSEEAFLTEVHHVSGEGNDAGVVYCEMQARENNDESRAEHAIQECVFVKDCGYKWETGGIMENLRSSCSNKKVKEYHKKFYRPENLDIIICGNVAIEAVFEAVLSVDNRAINVEYGPYTKPWSAPVEMFSVSTTKEIQFPANEEDIGRLSITWKGPDLEDMKLVEAHSIFWKYMMKTSASPLIKALVDIPKPFCSSIWYSSEEYPKTLVTVHFQGTFSSTCNEIKDIVMKTMQATLINGFDMERLQNMIKNEVCNFSDNLENDPAELLACNAIVDHLYGGDNHRILSVFVTLFEILEEVRNEGEQFWKNIIQYYSNEPCITIIATPSSQCMQDLETAEKERVHKQKEDLGEAGLLKRAKMLEDAIEFNDREFDDEVIDGLPKPSLHRNMSFHPVKTTNEPVSGIYLHEIKSDFCRFFMTFDTSKLSNDYKSLLRLYKVLFCDTPLVCEGETITYEDAIKKKEKLFQSTSCFVGTDVESCSELVAMEFKFMMEDFGECKTFVRDLIINKSFTVDRVETAVKKMDSAITSKLRKAAVVLSQLDAQLRFNGSCKSAIDLFTQQNLLASYQDNLPALAEKLNTLQQLLFYENKIVLHIIGNQSNLSRMSLPELKELYCLTKSEYPVPRSSNFTRPHATRKLLKVVPSDESSYMLVTFPSFADFTHHDDPVTALFSEYIGQLEGPFWKQIRGQGFAYNYYVANALTSGTLMFYLGKASNVTKGYLAAKEVIENIMDKKELDSSQIDTAKGALAFSIIDKFATPYSTAFVNVLNLQKGVSLDHDMKRLTKIMDVGENDLLRVCSQYFKHLFDNSAQVVICCPSNKEAELVKDMGSRGLHMTVIGDVNQYIMSELNTN